MSTALLSTTYFGPIQWYQKLYRYDRVLVEQHESFQKQTYRNRCVIATTQGTQALTVPVAAGASEKGEGIGDKYDYHVQHLAGETSLESNHTYHLSLLTSHLQRLSDHGNWRHLHWQALQSAYGESPFFEYYEDDLRPFFTERNWEYLIDYNEAICQKMCELLDIHPHVARTTTYIGGNAFERSTQSIRGNAFERSNDITADFRDAIRPKHPLPDPDFRPRPYYQVYQQKHGFLSNLSILDLLFNMGPESIFYL